MEGRSVSAVVVDAYISVWTTDSGTAVSMMDVARVRLSVLVGAGAIESSIDVEDSADEGAMVEIASSAISLVIELSLSIAELITSIWEVAVSMAVTEASTELAEVGASVTAKVELG